MFYSTMQAFIEKHSPELIDILRENMDGPMTVFLISDAAVNTLPKDTDQYLDTHASQFKQVPVVTLFRPSCLAWLLTYMFMQSLLSQSQSDVSQGGTQRDVTQWHCFGNIDVMWVK